MKTKIKVQTPVLEILTRGNRKGDKVINIELHARLKSELLVGTIEIDFTHLLPFVNKVSSDVLDFFLFTSAIYGIDRFIRRRRYSVDGWSRDFQINFPVRNVSIWNSGKEQIEKMLSFLTGDYWSLDFHQYKLDLPDTPLKKEFEDAFSKVHLFSGGLDSLIGALDHLKSKPSEKIILVSHYDKKMGGPKRDQADLLNLLNPIYGNQYVNVPSINVSLEKSAIGKTETTLRSRSLLFCGMALLIAQSKQIQQIIVPENGSVSLNFPLSSSRRSACSTRTTHPEVLLALNEIWSKWGLKTLLYNPYEFKTKGEMVAKCADQTNLIKLLDVSNSCGKRGHRAHWEGTGSHCGVCMPCVYRRASVLNINDKTVYGNNINNLEPQKKKARDMEALLNFLKKPHSKKEIRNELMINGIRNLTKLDQYADLVIRTRNELKGFIRKYGSAKIKSKAGL